MRNALFESGAFMTYTPASYAISYKEHDFRQFKRVVLNSPKDLIGYIHEYFHFFQDICSFSGFISFLNRYNNAVRLTQQTCLKSGETLSLPLKKENLGEIDQRQLEMRVNDN